MAVVPPPPTILGGVVTSTEQAAMAQAVSFCQNPPIAILRAVATQSLPNSTFTAINLDASDRDTVGGHSNVTNNTRYTAQYAGVYALGGSTAYALNATGARGAVWYVNGVALTAVGSLLPTLGASFGPTVPAPWQEVFLNVGDFVEIRAFQNSGGALNTGTGSGMSILWAGNG